MSLALSVEGLMLSKPALMSRKRVETFSLGLWRVLTSWMRARQESEELRPGREPHWLGRSSPLDCAMDDSLTAITLSRIFDIVLSRTIMRKEEGESLEALPSLSRTTPLAILSKRGWYPKVTRGEKRSRMMLGMMRLTLLDTE